MVWLLLGLALAGPYEFEEPIQGEIARPSASFLLSPPVRAEASVEAARQRLQKAGRAVDKGKEIERAGDLLELGDAHAGLASARVIEAYAAADAAFAAGGDAVFEPPSTEADHIAALTAWDTALATDSGALRRGLLERRAWVLNELGRGPEAVKVWQQIAAEFPGSVEAMRAEFQVAELLFVSGSIEEAVPLYARVASGSTDEPGAFAAYKLAWCRYSLGSVSEAIDGLVRVHADSRANGAIREEALSAAVIMAAELPGEGGFEVIARLCGTDAACAEKQRARLAQAHADMGRIPAR